MFKVSLVNPNFQTGPIHLNSYYLPYTAGVLWSYVMADDKLAKNFKINNWLFKREPIEQAVEECKDSDIALLSIYIWNQNYCYALAKKLKEHNPNIKIIVGGPQVEWRDAEYFEKYPFIDSIVIGEGELALKFLLECYLEGKELPKKNQFERIQDLDCPSPYLTGVFDELMLQHTDVEWVPTLETDRGCPYACTFCDWGSATASKMYKFYTDRIIAEVDWFVKHKLHYISMTASNFGVFKERDVFIAETIANYAKETGYPKGLTVSYAKNNNALILDIIKLFMDAKIQTGVTISLQTASKEVLENIKRSNMKINKISEITSTARKKNLPVSTELILGLPGETYSTWKDTLESVLEAKFVTMDIFFLQLLVNAPMYLHDREKFQIETFGAYDYFYDFDIERIQQEIKDGLVEKIEVIKSTSSMPNDQLLKSALFSWFIVGAHSYGVGIFMADYLFKKGIRYTDFYEELFDYLKDNNNNISQWADEFIKLHHRWYKLGYVDKSIGKLPNVGYGTMQSFTPLVQSSNALDAVLDAIGTFAKQRYGVPDNVIHDYKVLTDLNIKQFGKYIKQPIDVDLTSDILPAQSVTFTDRYNHFPETEQAHLEYLFLSIKKSWHLNNFTLN